MEDYIQGTFILPSDQYKKFRRMAKERRQPMSSIIRELITKWMEEVPSGK